MALRVEYFRRCLNCNFKDTNNPLALIYKKEFTEQQFVALTFDQQVAIVLAYMGLKGIKCPECNNQDTTAIAIQGIENFKYLERPKSYAASIIESLINTPSVNDFIECSVINQEAYVKLVYSFRLEIKTSNNQESTFLLKIYDDNSNVELWEYKGLSEQTCHLKRSESYGLAYIEFKNPDEDKMLLFEQDAFIQFVNYTHIMSNFSNKEAFSKERLKIIKDTATYLRFY